jgi:hypothetical protein
MTKFAKKIENEEQRAYVKRNNLLGIEKVKSLFI